MSLCNACPRNCNVDRKTSVGFCGANQNIQVAKAYLHEWEEPFISGANGSGTVFFSHCNLKCVFCQNYKISAQGFGKTVSQDELYSILKTLKNRGQTISTSLHQAILCHKFCLCLKNLRRVAICR